MPDSLRTNERARDLFEDGYYKENEGLVESILNIAEDDVDKAIAFYGKKHPEERPLTREQGEAMLDEYKIKEREWKQSSGISDSDSSAGPNLLSWIVFIIFIFIWLSIRYGKLLIATHKKAKLIDALDKRNNPPEIEEKCAYYRDRLKNLKTCPKDLKAVATTTNFMSAAGVVYLILSIFNFVSYYLQYDCGMIAPFSIMFGIQILLGFALMARHKLSAGILFGMQTLIGVFIMCFDMLVPQTPNRQFKDMWRFNIHGNVSVNGVAILAMFLVISAAFVIYFISNTKKRAPEILIYAGYIGCYIFAYTTPELAKRLELRTHFFTSQGLILSVPMLTFAWFVILYLMLKGKKNIYTNHETTLPQELFSTFSDSPKDNFVESERSTTTIPQNKKGKTIFLLSVVLFLGIAGAIGYSIYNANSSRDLYSQNTAEKENVETVNTQIYDNQSVIKEDEFREDANPSSETMNQVPSDTEQMPSSNELIETETISSEEPLLAGEETNETPAVSMDAISSVFATSYLIEAEYDLIHDPSNLFDESLSKAWVEAVSGHGEGESITVQLNETYKVSGFNINAGYQKNDDVYGKNSRPATLLVTFSDGTGIDITLKDVNEQQQIFFPSTVETSSITLTIQSVYPGSKYEDTVISEIQFF